jgi:hypothetical protein
MFRQALLIVERHNPARDAGDDPVLTVQPALGAVDQLVEVAHLAGRARHDQPAALPEIVVIDLGHGRAEAVLELRLRRFDVLALAFQRPRFREVQLDREDANVTRADGGIVAGKAVSAATRRQEQPRVTR